MDSQSTPKHSSTDEFKKAPHVRKTKQQVASSESHILLIIHKLDYSASATTSIYSCFLHFERRQIFFFSSRHIIFLPRGGALLADSSPVAAWDWWEPLMPPSFVVEIYAPTPSRHQSQGRCSVDEEESAAIHFAGLVPTGEDHLHDWMEEHLDDW